MIAGIVSEQGEKRQFPKDGVRRVDNTDKG